MDTMPSPTRRALCCRGAILLFGLALNSCSLFDGGTPWRDGKYALLWIDEPDEVELAYDEGNGGWSALVDPRVFAAGSDERYVVVKQHPRGDRSITNYFIVDRRLYAKKNPNRAVTGPFTASEFESRQRQLQLPGFTTVLASLE